MTRLPRRAFGGRRSLLVEQVDGVPVRQSPLYEVLREAGFRSVDVYWEDEDKRGKGLGTFRKRKIAPADATWNAYIVAKR